VELAEQIIGYLSYKTQFSDRNLGEIADIPVSFHYTEFCDDGSGN